MNAAVLEAPEVPPPPTTERKLARRVVAALALAAIAAVSLLLPMREILERFLEWVAAAGPWGPLAYTGSYVPATVVFAPGSLLALGAGFAFGVLRGALVCVVGGTLGSSAAFFLGRTLLRGWVEERIRRSPELAAFDRAVAQRGFQLVFLARLSLIFPYNLLGYAAGAMKVRFRDFLLASLVGMIPGTFLYVSLGTAARSVHDLVSGRPEHGWAMLALVLVAATSALAFAVVVAREARKAMKKATRPQRVHQAA